MNARGQALIEWALLVPLFTLLMIGSVIFGQWFLIRQQLILAAREGAFLYSSGRLNKNDVKHQVQRTLVRGFPSIRLAEKDIVIQRVPGLNALLLELDQVTIRYRLPQHMRIFFTLPLEESCVIKHASPYRLAEWPLTFGPPVKW